MALQQNLHIDGAAFLRGFWKGLGAPAMLYQMNALPDIPRLEKILPSSLPLAQVFANDWGRVGGDIDCVANRHGKER